MLDTSSYQDHASHHPQVSFRSASKAAGPSGRGTALVGLVEMVAKLVATPVRRVIAVSFITGNTIRALVDEVRRLIVRALGFLAMRPKTRWLQVRALRRPPVIPLPVYDGQEHKRGLCYRKPGGARRLYATGGEKWRLVKSVGRRGLVPRTAECRRVDARGAPTAPLRVDRRTTPPRPLPRRCWA